MISLGWLTLPPEALRRILEHRHASDTGGTLIERRLALAAIATAALAALVIALI